MVSVEKCRYETIEEGAQVTIQIFIDVLRKLKDTYHWNIYIHPIVPVLNETRYAYPHSMRQQRHSPSPLYLFLTRFIVKTFNQVLQKMVEAVNGLHWLNFFDKLLTSDGEGFNKKYELDGTHMNPTYIALLADALNATDS